MGVERWATVVVNVDLYVAGFLYVESVSCRMQMLSSISPSLL